jgi:hypothetical protein
MPRTRGMISFLGKIRKLKSGQMVLTIPSKFRELVNTEDLIWIGVSDEKDDLKRGEQIINK